MVFTNKLIAPLHKSFAGAGGGFVTQIVTKIAGRKLIMVFLDSAGKFSRLADAERVRRWVESGSVVAADARRVSS